MAVPSIFKLFEMSTFMRKISSLWYRKIFTYQRFKSLANYRERTHHMCVGSMGHNHSKSLAGKNSFCSRHFLSNLLYRGAGNATLRNVGTLCKLLDMTMSDSIYMYRTKLLYYNQISYLCSPSDLDFFDTSSDYKITKFLFLSSLWLLLNL